MAPERKKETIDEKDVALGGGETTNGPPVFPCRPWGRVPGTVAWSRARAATAGPGTSSSRPTARCACRATAARRCRPPGSSKTPARRCLTQKVQSHFRSVDQVDSMSQSDCLLMASSTEERVETRRLPSPDPSTLIKCGWKSASGASNRSPPTLMMRPSGSCGFRREKQNWVSFDFKDRLGNAPCTTRRGRSSRAPVSVRIRCCSRCSRVSPWAGAPSQSRPCGWRRSPATGATGTPPPPKKKRVARVLESSIVQSVDPSTRSLS